MGTKRAVLVGCLYRKPPYELQGCINDVSCIKSLLTGRFNFLEENIQVLTDDTFKKPTKKNIMAALNAMIHSAGHDDVLFFFFSGYGTLTENQHAIVPLDALDGNYLINSNEFRTLVNDLPTRATLTIAADAGYSGGLIDGEKLQINTSSAKNEFNNVLETKIKSKSIFTHSTPGSPIMADTGTESNGGILLSACQPDETAFEVVPSPDSADAFGAFTRAIKKVLDANPDPIKNSKLVIDAWQWLNTLRVDQHPCLYCSNEKVDAIFLSQQSESQQH